MLDSMVVMGRFWKAPGAGKGMSALLTANFEQGGTRGGYSIELLLAMTGLLIFFVVDILCKAIDYANMAILTMRSFG